MDGFAVSSDFEKVGSVPKIIKTICTWQDGPGCAIKTVIKTPWFRHASDGWAQLSIKATFTTLTGALARLRRAILLVLTFHGQKTLKTSH